MFARHRVRALLDRFFQHVLDCETFEPGRFAESRYVFERYWTT